MVVAGDRRGPLSTANGKSTGREDLRAWNASRDVIVTNREKRKTRPVTNRASQYGEGRRASFGGSYWFVMPRFWLDRWQSQVDRVQVNMDL